MELTDFLLARIAEDEREWGDPAFAPVAGQGLSRLVLKMRAECDAKRQIVRCYQEARRTADGTRAVFAGDDSPYSRAEQSVYTATAAAWWVALAVTALPYADHDDYREEWRP